MKIIYLYTNLNWYRIELFRSISKLLDCHIYILNGYTIGYESIDYKPEYEGLNITFLSKEESQFKNLHKILDAEEFDSLVIPSMNDAFYLKLSTRLSHYFHKKGKTVLYFWEYWPMDKGTYSLSKWAKQEIRHLFIKINRTSIDYFITPSINTYSFYQKMKIPSWKLVRCPNASEVKQEGTELYSNVRHELGIQEHEKIILYFGRIEEYKGIHELIISFNRLDRKDWHLLICGPGEEKISEEIKGKTNIHAVGGIRPEKRAEYYAASDLFVLANTYRNKIEPWGLTVNEAMQFGLPIIASNATGSAIDLVFSGLNGFIIDANRIEDDLVFYINHILSDEKLKRDMGEQSKRIISEYTFDNMALAFAVATEKGSR